MSWVTPPSPASGGASSATAAAQYLVLAANATLTGERIFAAGPGLTATDGGANGNYSLSMTSRVLDQSGASFTSSGTLTVNLITYVIPPSQLGTDKSLRLVAFGWHRNAGVLATISATFRVILGATTLYADVMAILGETTPVSAGWFVDIKLTAENSANAQVVSGQLFGGIASLGATTGVGNLATDELAFSTTIFGSSALSTDVSLTLVVDFLGGGSVGSQTFVKKYHVLRLI